MTVAEQDASTFEQAAEVWEKLRLPDFLVQGHLDGRTKTWNIPELLRTAADRMRLQQAQR
jgi:hypothetical protein